MPRSIGRDFESVVRTAWSNADAEEVLRRFRHTLQTGEPQVVPEFIALRKDRQLVEYYEWQVHRIPLPGGRRGVVCYFRDISKSVLAREALREADNRKDEFLATLSHELRNPLAPLRSSLEIVKRLATAPPSASAALEIMDRQLSHLVRLVDDLLEVSRITRGQVELRREQLRLDAAIHSAIETSEPLIRAGNHRLIVSLPARAADAGRRSGAARADLRQPAQQRREVFGQGRADRDRRASRRRRSARHDPRQRRRHSAGAVCEAVPDFHARRAQRSTQSERSRYRTCAGAAADRNARRPGRSLQRGYRQRQLLQRAPAAERQAGRCAEGARPRPFAASTR